MKPILHYLLVFAVIGLWSCTPSGDAPKGKQGDGAPRTGPNDATKGTADSGAKAAQEISLYRLRNTAILEAQRDTSEGYLAAAEAFKRCLARKELPNDLINLARVYLLSEIWDDASVDAPAEALRVLARHRELVPPKDISPAVDYLEGLALDRLLKTKEAAEKFRAAATSAPEVAAAWFQLGTMLERLRRPEEALEALLKVLPIAPEHTSAIYKIYRAHVVLRNVEAQKEWLAKYNKVYEKVGKVPPLHWVKCRFTRLTLLPHKRSLAEPPAVQWAFEPVPLPEELAALPLRDLAVGRFSGDATSEQVELLGTSGVVRLLADGAAVTIGPQRDIANPSDLRRAVAWDYDNDRGVDLLILDGGRLRVLRNTLVGDEETAKASGKYEEALTLGIEGSDISGFLPTDYDHDGDLDVITLEHSGDMARTIAYRNNGDASFFRIVDLFPASVTPTPEARLCAVDLDRGNDTDFVVPNRGGAAVALLNLRSVGFRAAPIDDLSGTARLVSFDLNNDGDMDLVGASSDSSGGILVATSRGGAGTARLPGFSVETMPTPAGLGRIHDLEPADVDADGDIDLLVAAEGGLLFLRNEEGGKLRAVALPEALGAIPEGPWRRIESLDLDRDCRLDVLAIGPNDRLFAWFNRAETYEAAVLFLAGSKDNTTSVGTHVEVFSGQQYQRLRVNESREVWIGLGTKSAADLDGIGLTWPNGIGQALEPTALAACRIDARQPPGPMSSCPFLYTFDGREYRFLTDVIAIAPLDEWLPPGGTPHMDPEEFVRIPSRHLKAIEDELRVVITEELRETTYLDRAVLVRVLHPRGTEVYLDESTRQGKIEPLRVFIAQTSTLRTGPVHTSTQDVKESTRAAASQDGDYLQGYLEKHSQWSGWVDPYHVDIDLPADLTADTGALLLTGRVHWYDSTTAFSLHQHGRSWLPHSLDVVDASGKTRPVLADIGLPSGMDRTVVVPLGGKIDSESRQLRLTATHRLLWDHVQIATAGATAVLEPGETTTVRLGEKTHALRAETLALKSSTLDYHGFSRVVGDSARHRQTYDFSAPSAWRDFPLPTGRATRYGDVQELVADADDRLVIIPPGDAVWMSFGSGRPPAADQTVTYFLKLTGWCKESAFHVSSGRAIAPLPHTNMRSYRDADRDAPRSATYRAYLEDFHTRLLGGEL